MTAILKYWQLAAGIVIGFFLAWSIQDHVIKGIEAKHKETLAAQIRFDIQQCNDDKKITEEISHGLQNNLTDLNNKLRALKLRQPTRCLMPVTKPATGHDDTSAASVDAGSDGVTSDALIDYAGDAEKYRLQLVSCQGFVKKVWQKHATNQQ